MLWIGSPNASQRRKSHRRQRAARKEIYNEEQPSANTRSKTVAKSDLAAPPSMETRSRCKSFIQQPTKGPSKTGTKIKLPELAAAAWQRRTKKQIRQLTCRINRIENKVHKAMAVIDANSGKMLNYWQLMKDPKYQCEWSISSANEFGRLANGVVGHIKRTNTIKFVHKHQVP